VSAATNVEPPEMPRVRETGMAGTVQCHLGMILILLLAGVGLPPMRTRLRIR
jgi:hypothetical protein